MVYVTCLMHQGPCQLLHDGGMIFSKGKESMELMAHCSWKQTEMGKRTMRDPTTFGSS
jgi:hypothetical protein